ncbi:MAG: hypothetical protein ACPG46_03155 [Thalassotalea sp.]
MAVISCPSCKKKVSDKAKACSHCKLDFQNMDEEKLHTINKIKVINQSQQMMMHSFIAMLLFCGGFLFFYSQDAQPGTWQYIVSIMSTIVGFIFYIVTRIRLVLLKRRNK